MVTGNQSNSASIRIEVLKNTSKLVGMPARGPVYKNINAWIDFKRIKNATIRFKVENSWIGSNGLSVVDVKLYRWDNNNKGWIGLLTGVLNKDDEYTYFESQTNNLSASFAISGNVSAKAGSSINSTRDVREAGQTENKPVSTENAKASGFEIVLAAVSILSIVYLQRIKG